jgi:hypothetical protein
VIYQSYERLTRINTHLTEAMHQLGQLGYELKVNETALRSMADRVEKIRQDANNWIANRTIPK